MVPTHEPESGDLFSYTPLTDPSSHIRLAHLCPSLASTIHGDIPQITLTHAALDASPTYTALSYAWGDPNDTLPILIEGKLKFVTRNLFSFLKQATISHGSGTTATCTFWIDAISINQQDDAEKSEQVRMMGRIFSSAADVTIWLGPSSEDLNLAFQFLGKLSKAYASRSKNGLSSSSSEYREALYLLAEYIQNHCHETLEPLESLLLRSWWRRVWVQQEVSFANLERTTMVAGEAQIPWIKVVQGYVLLHDLYTFNLRDTACQGRAIVRKGQKDMINEIIRVVQQMARMCQHSIHRLLPDEPSSHYDLAMGLIVNAISHVTRMQSSLPVDYVYSLLGIIADRDSAAHYIKADYSKPTEDVFIAVMRYLLTTSGAVVLGFCGVDVCGDLPLASFVPNWSAPLIRLPLCWRRDLFGPDYVSTLYNASGVGSTFDYEMRASRLFLRGSEVDVLTRYGTPADLFRTDATFSDSNWTHDWFRSYETFRSRIAPRNLEHLDDAWWRVPVADQQGISVHSTSSFSIPSRTVRSRMWDSYVESKTSLLKNATSALSSSVSEYEAAMELVALNRIPFLSRNGLLGLGPSTIKPDDKIFVISGCQTPLILREAGNGQYRIVGDAYVHGIMDGEFTEREAKIETLQMVRKKIYDE